MDEPKVNEVWKTNGGNYALIVAGPSEYFEIDTVAHLSTVFRSQVFPTRKSERGSGLLMLWCDCYDGYTVSEIMSRLKEKTDFTPADFFARTAETYRRHVDYAKYLKEKDESPVEEETVV